MPSPQWVVPARARILTLASVSKDKAIELLDGVESFVAIPQSRRDYVAFLWSDKPDRSQAVLVEIFCEQFPGRSTLEVYLDVTP